MFKTLRDAELLPDLCRRSPEAQFWSYVELGVAWPWFYVVLVEESQLHLHRSYVLVPSIPLLQELLCNVTPDAWIEKVYVVTPSGINGTEGWKMEPLVKLSGISTDDGVFLGHQYLVPEGTCYSTLMGSEQQPTLVNVLIFSASLHLGNNSVSH